MKDDKWTEWVIEHQATDTRAVRVEGVVWLYGRDENNAMHRFKLEDD